MKALINERRTQVSNIPFLLKKNETKIRVIDFKKVHNNYLLQLAIPNVSEDNYRLFIKGFYLTLIISEQKEVNRPVHIHNMTWDFYKNSNYELMRNIDIWLPGDNFYLIKHYSVPEDQLLNIFLGKMHFN
jgi:hypothetical protein